MYQYSQQQQQQQHHHHQVHLPAPRHILDRCPIQLGTYARLHLDTIGKILNHFLALNLVCNVFLFFSSFSVSLLEHNLGFDTVLCSFLLAAATVVVLLIVNNSRISALSILQPTEYMVGLATGLCIGSAVLAAVLSSTYKTISQCVPSTSSSSTDNDATNNIPTTTDTNATQAPTQYPAAAAAVDPNYEYMCNNIKTSFSSIWFWAGLSAWLYGVSAMLLLIGRHQLASASASSFGGQNHSSYETIGGGGGATTTPSSPLDASVDFEERFRRQQQEILGGSQHAEIQQRAAAMFVGDYSTVPEVTQHPQQQQQQQGGGSSTNNTNNANASAGSGETAAFLSV